MRTFLSIGLLLMLTRCIVIPLPGGWTVSFEHRRAEQRVRTDLGVLQKQILLGATSMRVVRCAAGECYTHEDVMRLVDEVRRESAAVFPAAAVGLRDAVDAVIAEELRRLGPAQPLATIQRVRLQDPSADTGYVTSAVVAMLQRMAEGIERFLRYDKLALNLTVKSAPRGADFVIQIRDNQQSRRTARTNDKLPNVWRGIYTATVQKSGYKDAVAVVDLINDSRTRIVCTLRRQNEPDSSSCRPY